MKRLLLLLFLGIFLISFISADSSIGTAPQNKCIQLTQVCDNCTQVNLTKIIYPNQTLSLLGNFIMTKNNSNYNYTYCDTSTLGDYFYTTCGNLNGINTCNNIGFKVTQTGTQASVSEGIIYAISFVGVLLLFVICLYFAITIPFRNTRGDDSKILSVNKFKYIKLGLIPICYGLFNWILNLFLGLSDLLSLTMYQGFFSFLFSLFVRLSWPFLVLWGIIFLVTLKNDANIGQLLKRGFRPK